jgi:hypothetical protein
MAIESVPAEVMARLTGLGDWWKKQFREKLARTAAFER